MIDDTLTRVRFPAVDEVDDDEVAHCAPLLRAIRSRPVSRAEVAVAARSFEDLVCRLEDEALGLDDGLDRSALAVALGTVGLVGELAVADLVDEGLLAREEERRAFRDLDALLRRVARAAGSTRRGHAA